MFNVSEALKKDMAVGTRTHTVPLEKCVYMTPTMFNLLHGDKTLIAGCRDVFHWDGGRFLDSNEKGVFTEGVYGDTWTYRCMQCFKEDLYPLGYRIENEDD